MPLRNQQQSLSLTPGAQSLVGDLGLGDMLGKQVQEETAEQRRRRLMLEQMQDAVNPMGAPSMLGLAGRSRGSTPLGY